MAYRKSGLLQVFENTDGRALKGRSVLSLIPVSQTLGLFCSFLVVLGSLVQGGRGIAEFCVGKLFLYHFMLD